LSKSQKFWSILSAFERIFIEKYFSVVEILTDDNMNIYYSLSKKELRKIKLLTLNDDELSLLFKKIFRDYKHQLRIFLQLN